MSTAKSIDWPLTDLAVGDLYMLHREATWALHTCKKNGRERKCNKKDLLHVVDRPLLYLGEEYYINDIDVSRRLIFLCGDRIYYTVDSFSGLFTVFKPMQDND